MTAPEHGPPLEAVASAQLPMRYEAAKTALAECDRIDECREWADRAAALASYARQANDIELRNMCVRIQDRAVRRCGELLKQIPPAPGARTDIQPRAAADPRLDFVEEGFRRVDGIYAAGRDAKLSPRQVKTSLRVANVPADEFELLVEGDNPPTVTALAEIGIRKSPERPDYLKGRAPADFEQATRLIGLVDWIEDRRTKLDLDRALRGLDQDELHTLTIKVHRVSAWLAGLEETLDGI